MRLQRKGTPIGLKQLQNQYQKNEPTRQKSTNPLAPTNNVISFQQARSFPSPLFYSRRLACDSVFLTILRTLRGPAIQINEHAIIKLIMQMVNEIE